MTKYRWSVQRKTTYSNLTLHFASKDDADESFRGSIAIGDTLYVTMYEDSEVVDRWRRYS